MISEILQKAREYEERIEREIEAEDKPKFHLSARVGWLNDPNGFSFYNGVYHLFYQYYPYDTKWGPMHWGHAVSEDLLHWTYLPAALAPDMAYDTAGCFSGSAAALPDGRQLLMYTGVYKEMQSDGSVREIQTQCVAFGDGRDYEKYRNNPVLEEKDLPKHSSRYDFRDPKMWYGSDGILRCVIAGSTKEGDGQIYLFNSPDGIGWKFKKVLVSNRQRFGKIWECPDFFELDGKWVLIASPTEMLPKEPEYYNGNGTLCLIGTYDEKEEIFSEEQDQAVDYGIDYYAPATMLSPDGRRIMIGWMQNWDTCGLYKSERAWFGQMSLPRELSIKNGRLMQKPVRELNGVRGNEIRYDAVTVSAVTKLKGIKGRTVDMELAVRPVDPAAPYRRFEIRFAQDDLHFTSVSYCPETSAVCIDRTFSGSRRAAVHQRMCYVNSDNGKINLRMILDTFSAEIFVNDGAQALSMTFYTDPAADGISFLADGAAVMDVIKYDL